MTIYNANLNCTWSTDEQTDEVYTLFESDDKIERILVYRNNEMNTEYMMLSPSLIKACERYNPLGSNIIFPEQYWVIKEFQRKIEGYQLEKGIIEWFSRFFGVSMSEFFHSIAPKTAVNQTS
jgi:hypothetical protein